MKKLMLALITICSLTFADNSTDTTGAIEELNYFNECTIEALTDGIATDSCTFQSEIEFISDEYGVEVELKGYELVLK